MTVIQYQIAFTKQAAKPPTQNSSYPQERKEVPLKPRHTRGPTEKEPSCSNSMLRCHNLKLSEAPFFPSSLEATYICNMIWFKKMPSARSMYMVRLSWLPLPKEPKVFTCRVGGAERKAGKVTPERPVQALQGKGRQSLCGKSGSPTPAHPSAGEKPTPLQALYPHPAPGNRQNFLPAVLRCPRAKNNNKNNKTKRDFLINFSRLKPTGNDCSEPSLYAFSLGDPIPAATHLLVSEVQKLHEDIFGEWVLFSSGQAMTGPR